MFQPESQGRARARRVMAASGYGKTGGHFKKGGRLAEDEASDKTMVEAGVHQHERHDHPGESLTKLKLAAGGRADGGMAGQRMDQKPRSKSKGGDKAHTKINILVSPHPGGGLGGPPGAPPPGAGAMPPRPPMPMPAPPPRPPMAGPPGMPVGGAPVMPPPGGAPLVGPGGLPPGAMPPRPPIKTGGAVHHRRQMGGINPAVAARLTPQEQQQLAAMQQQKMAAMGMPGGMGAMGSPTSMTGGTGTATAAQQAPMAKRGGHYKDGGHIGQTAGSGSGEGRAQKSRHVPYGPKDGPGRA